VTLTIKKLSLVMAILPALLMFIVLIWQTLKLSSELDQQHVAETTALLQALIADNAEFALATGDNRQLQKIIAKQVTRPDIYSIEVRDENGAVFTRSVNPDNPRNSKNTITFISTQIESVAPALDNFDDDSLHISASPNQSMGESSPSTHVVGELTIGLNTGYIEAQQQQSLIKIAALAIATFLVAIASAIIASSQLTKPVSRALQAIGQLRSGNLKANTIADSRIHELTLLSQDINDLAQQLQAAAKAQEKSRQETEQHLWELSTAREAADRANLSKTRFLATISHELRTPLNSVIGMLQILEDTDLKPLQDNYVGLAHSQALLLQNLVNDILDFAQVEYGELKLHCQYVPIKELLLQTAESFRLLAEEKQLTFRVHIQGDESLYQQPIYTDPVRLQQIVTNLLSNAIKFTLQGSIDLTLFLETQEAESDLAPQQLLHVSVTDTGIGISPEQQTMIFELFQQVDDSSTRNFDGCGLGLTIASELARLLQGHIRVQSVQGKGSTFTFTAPINRLAPALPTESKAIDQRPVNESVNTKRVLVVEDNKANQKVISGLLALRNIQVDIADSAAAALEKTHHYQYPLIFIDCFMPEMDGFTLAEKICQEQLRNPAMHTKKPVLIGISADVQPSTRERCFECGMDDFIVKPISKFELFQKIEHHFSAEQAVRDIMQTILPEKK